MTINVKKTHGFSMGWVIVLIFPLLASCVTDEKLAYTNDQIDSTNNKVASLEYSTNEKIASLKESIEKSIDKKLAIIDSNQAVTTVEIDQLKGLYQ
jgi:hypothetical protein